MKKLLTLLVIVFCFAGLAIAQPPAKKPPAIKGMHYLEIPSGIFLRAIVQSAVSTSTNNINDPVRAIIDSNFYFIDTICIPENSIIEGQITEFQLPKKGRNGFFKIHFNKLRFPNGKEFAFNGDLWMDGSDLIGGQTSALSETREVPFCAGGMNYILMKPTGEYSMGQHVTLPAGSEVLIKTNQGITVDMAD